MDDGDCARQVHVMGVVEDVIVQNAVRAYLCQNRGSVDQHRSVLAGDRTNDRLEIGLAANWKGIQISGDDELLGGLAPFPGPRKKLAQAIMAFGKFGALCDQPAVCCDRLFGIGLLSRPGRPEFRREFYPGFGGRIRSAPIGRVVGPVV